MQMTNIDREIEAILHELTGEQLLKALEIAIAISGESAETKTA